MVITKLILQVINQNIYGFAETPSFSTSYNLWKGVIDTVTKNILQVINQNIYGFLFLDLQRKGFL
jgi:hypothetical protein